MISISKFNINEQIIKQGLIAILGTKGKKEILLKILQQERFEDEEIHLFTPDMYFDKDEWLEEDDQLDFKVHSSITDIDEVREEWGSKQLAHKIEFQQTKNDSIVIAFYRFLQRSDFKLRQVRDLAMNSVNRRIRTIFVVDSLRDMPREIFSNIRQIIFLKEESKIELQNIREHFFRELTFDTFQEIFNTTTENGKALVLETTLEIDISERMFFIE